MNKKFLSVAASTAIVASALVFTGCGDSDSRSSSSSSSTTSSGGSLTGTFVKGLWSGVPYTYSNGTKSATTGTGMLCDKNRVSPHRRLLSVIRNIFWCKPCSDKIFCMGADFIHSLFINIVNVLLL